VVRQQPEHEHHLHASLSSLDTSVAAWTAAARSLLASRSVLACETWQFDSHGVITRSWHVPFASVAVDARASTQPVTVTSSPVSEVIPTSGVGLAVIPTGKAAVCNIAGRALTLYGKAGDTVTIQVFPAAQSPAWG